MCDVLKSPKAELGGGHVITQENVHLGTASSSKGSVFHFHGPCLREFNLHQICN